MRLTPEQIVTFGSKKFYVLCLESIFTETSETKLILKGIAHPKIKILSVLFQPRKTFVHLLNKNLDIFNEMSDSCFTGN